MTCPAGATLNEQKLCVMAPLFTCPSDHALNPATNKCVPSSNVAVVSATPVTAVTPAAPAAPAPQSTVEPKCPTGYEYRDSMCYPLKN